MSGNPLTILSVGYPLAPVGPDAVGGSEQILYQIDAALTRAGHRSIVVAPEDSRVEGTLVATPKVPGPFGPESHQLAQRRHAAAIARALARHRVDLIHMHSLDFHAYLPRGEVPLLVTLHLPPDWYPPDAYRTARPNTWLSCVSRAQAGRCPPEAEITAVIENGVPVDRLSARHAVRDFFLCLGRICPEKGFHLALEAARAVDARLLIGGETFPYEAHIRYFEDEVRPLLGERRRFLGPLSFERKRRFLSAARALIVPSLVAETSSLVAMEAMACGTPVIAFDIGALGEVVEPGRTGILVENAAQLPEAMRRVATIDRAECRRVAQARFSVERMTGEYLALYASLLSASRNTAPQLRRRTG